MEKFSKFLFKTLFWLFFRGSEPMKPHVEDVAKELTFSAFLLGVLVGLALALIGAAMAYFNK